MSDLATLHHNYMYNNRLYNEYKRYNNTLLDSRGTSASLNESLYKNGIISLKRYEAFYNCNKDQKFTIIRAKDPQKPLKIVRQNTCGNPHCVYCRRKEGKKTEKKIAAIISKYQDRKLLTVAFSNEQALSKRDIKKKSEQFARLMRNLNIKRYLRVIEIKSIGNGYNIHIHAVIDNKYIPVERISQEFRKVTKGCSYIVDIRGITGLNNESNRSKSYSASYISKYMSKFPVMQSMMEYYQFFSKLKGTRFLYATEKATKTKLSKEQFNLMYDIIYNCDDQDVKDIYSVWCDNYFLFIGIGGDKSGIL